MRFLSGDDIMAALTRPGVMDAVERALALYESGDYRMPERLSVACGERDLFLLMPCVADGSVVAKVLTIYPDNPAQGRPMIQGIVLLADQATAEFLALMDAKTVTAMRTGAVSGISIRYLARSDASSVGLVGCGTQGFYQLLYACTAREIQRIMLYDVVENAVPPFVTRLREALPGTEIKVAASTAALARASDILITATTARTPVFPNDPTLFHGKHCIAIGSFQPDVREYPDALFEVTERAWVDLDFAMEESGELMIPLERGLLAEAQVETLGHFIASGRAPERRPHGTTFFKTVGMALFDLTTARLAYKKAVVRDLGTHLPG